MTDIIPEYEIFRNNRIINDLKEDLNGEIDLNNYKLMFSKSLESDKNRYNRRKKSAKEELDKIKNINFVKPEELYKQKIEEDIKQIKKEKKWSKKDIIKFKEKQPEYKDLSNSTKNYYIKETIIKNIENERLIAIKNYKNNLIELKEFNYENLFKDLLIEYYGINVAKNYKLYIDLLKKDKPELIEILKRKSHRINLSNQFLDLLSKENDYINNIIKKNFKNSEENKNEIINDEDSLFIDKKDKMKEFNKIYQIGNSNVLIITNNNRHFTFENKNIVHKVNNNLSQINNIYYKHPYDYLKSSKKYKEFLKKNNFNNSNKANKINDNNDLNIDPNRENEKNFKFLKKKRKKEK